GNGYNLFCQVNRIRQSIPLPLHSFPRFPVRPAGINNLNFVMTSGPNVIEMSTSEGGVPAGETHIVEATPPISPTVNNYLTKLTQIASLVELTGYPQDVYGYYTAKYGVPATGQRIGFRVTPINNN